MKILRKFNSKNENTRIIVSNTIYSFGIKGLSMCIALFTTPAYMRYFNNQEILGIWFTILSVLAWILNCDMGIGNGLRNKLVYAFVMKDNIKAKKYISSAYIFLGIISIVIICILFLFSRFISWNKIFNISINILNISVLNKAMIILLLSIILQFILRLITSILYALQKSFVPGLLNFITNAAMLIFVTICNYTLHNNNIIQLSIAYLIAVNLPLLVTTIIVFSTNLKNVIPSIKYYSKDYAMDTLKIGGAFLWLQLMSMILNNTNSYLITLFIGNTAVVEYQIYYKIFSLIGIFITLITTPIWSAVTKVQSENNFVWLKKLYEKMIAVGVLAICSEFFIIFPLQFIFNIWLKEKSISVNYSYAIIFAISGSLLIWTSIITCFVNGLFELKIQTIFLTGGALVNIPLTYFFAQNMHSYISIIVANIISILPYCIIQTIWLHRYLKRKIIIYQGNK